MADTKISALPASTTPLAGTEVLPIVQGGATKQVSVANLTAGRAPSVSGLTVSGLTASTAVALNASKELISVTNTGTGDNVLATAPTLVGNVTLSTGNLIIGTSGQGIDFSATPGTGTSELLDDYEEGTWTPDQGAGLTVVGAFTSSGVYTRVGRLVTVIGVVTGATTIACTANGIISTNLPFAAGVSLNAVGVAFTTTENPVIYGTATANQIRSNLAIVAVANGINFTISYMTS